MNMFESVRTVYRSKDTGVHGNTGKKNFRESDNGQFDTITEADRDELGLDYDRTDWDYLMREGVLQGRIKRSVKEALEQMDPTKRAEYDGNLQGTLHILPRLKKY